MIKKICLLIVLTCFIKQSDAQIKIDTSHPGHLGFVIADGAIPKLIAKQFSFTEGPASDKKGNVFFTDQPNNKIWKYGKDGKLSVFLDSAGRSNGLYFDKRGNLITCADGYNQLWSINKAGKVTVLLKDFQGLHFNGPNDLWIHPKGKHLFH
ncbi:MAG: SMP-30/gluconolactonase/LRE family protein [Ginsengibacter sp.]